MCLCNYHDNQHACLHYLFSHVQLSATLWTVAHQAPSVHGQARILEWVAVPFSNQGIEHLLIRKIIPSQEP